MQQKRLVRSATDSISRVAETRAEVASRVASAPVTKNVESLTKPNSVSKTMRTVGMALLASPDIITDVPGVALVATSQIMKRKDPTSIGQLASETRKVLRDIESLRL